MPTVEGPSGERTPNTVASAPSDVAALSGVPQAPTPMKPNLDVFSRERSSYVPATPHKPPSPPLEPPVNIASMPRAMSELKLQVGRLMIVGSEQCLPSRQESLPGPPIKERQRTRLLAFLVSVCLNWLVQPGCSDGCVLRSCRNAVLVFLVGGTLPSWRAGGALARLLPKDADAEKSIEELIEARGYPVESHQVVTHDGYVLGLYRIPRGRVDIEEATKTSTGSTTPGCDGASKAPMLLMHGLFGSAITWVANYADQSLDSEYLDGHVTAGYILADAGYDVWLANLRGSTLSRKHINIDPDRDASFWNFSKRKFESSFGSRLPSRETPAALSFTPILPALEFALRSQSFPAWLNPCALALRFQQMIEYDVPATIDYILRETGKSRLGYVGHSQGTLVMFGLLSAAPAYNDKVTPPDDCPPSLTMNQIVLVGVGSTTKGTLLLQTGLTRHNTIPQVALFVALAPVRSTVLKMGEIGEYGPVWKQIADRLCRAEESVSFCETMWNILFGPSVMVNKLVKTGRFCKYDYGAAKNKRLYGQTVPPCYPLENIRTPVAIFWGHGDTLSRPQDIDLIRSRVSSVVVDERVGSGPFNHNDFIYGVNAKRVLHDRIVQLLRQFYSLCRSQSSE
nr:lipase 3-like [Dermacentor andersoni]